MAKRRKNKELEWTLQISGQGEATIELPRFTRSDYVEVRDMPGVPGSNSSDPSWVAYDWIWTPFWAPNQLALSWNVAVPKIVTFVCS